MKPSGSVLVNEGKRGKHDQGPCNLEREKCKESIPCSLCHVRWLDKEPWVEQRRKHFTLGGEGRRHTAENFKMGQKEVIQAGGGWRNKNKLPKHFRMEEQ